MLPTWLYIPRTTSGESYTVTSGDVVTVTEPTALENTPEGWQDILIGYERNMTKVGTVRSFTFPLGFVRGGARILRHLLYSNSFEEKILLTIQKLTLEKTALYWKWVYGPFYEGEIDLATLKDEEYKVSVSVAETGLPKALKANEGTTYEIDLDTHPDKVFVKMDGVYLKEKHNWLLTESEITMGQIGYLLGCYFLTKEGQAAGFANSNQDQLHAPFDTYDFANSLNYFATVTQDIDGLHLTGTLKLGLAAGRARIIVVNQDRVEKAVLVNTTVSGTFEVDATWDAVAGERYFLYYDAVSITKLIVMESNISIEFMSRYRTTVIKGLMEETLGKELTGKVTGDKTLFYSSMLKSGEKIVVTSIDAVRGIKGAKIKTSLNTYLDYCKAVHAAGSGVEDGKIRVEKFAHFLKTTNPHALGNARDLKTSVATDLLANTFKVGYNTPSIDDVNGKYSFNNTLLFTSPVTKITKEHAILSPYYADPYFIEIKRINFDGKTTTDDSADNDIVVLNVEPIAFTSGGTVEDAFIFGPTFGFTSPEHLNDFAPGSKFTLSGTASNNKTFTVQEVFDFGADGFLVAVEEPVVYEVFSNATFTTNIYKLKRKPYTAVEGLPTGVESSLFNIEYLTPKRMLQRHLTWLNSILWGLQGQFMKYQTTEKNAGLKTTYGADIVDEDADVEIGEDRLFLPFYHEFDTRVPVNLPALMEADPNASFSTDWNGVTLKGILIKAGIAPDTNKEQAWKLLSAPDNDLTQLING
jgi:hypothetical protein